jgi:capsular polysaccharide biosynthesis protein
VLTDELGALAASIWRRRVVVVLVTLLLGAASWYTVRSSDTVYTSSAALTVTSVNRGPEQDAVLSQGYAAFFNDPLFQERLRKDAEVPDDISFEATTGLASPLLYVTASSTDSRQVATAARRMAEALRTEINDAIDGNREQVIADLREAFEELSTTSTEVPDQVVVDLNERIGEITGDSSNKLQVVQLNSFVQASEPPTTRMLALGLAGGLFLGCVLAVVLGAVSRRIETAAQTERMTGLTVAAEVPPTRDPVTDAQLWTVLRSDQDTHGALLRAIGRAEGDAGAAVVAVTSPRRDADARDVATRLADAASRTGRTLLIDLGADTVDRRPGLTNYVLDENVKTSRVIRKVSDDLSTIGRGTASTDLYSALNDPRSAELIEVVRRGFSTIVIASPSTLDSAESLAMCSLADQVVLVAEQGRSRTGDVTRSAQLLAAVVTSPLQLVLITRGRSRRRTSRLGAGADGGVETPVAAELSRVP